MCAMIFKGQESSTTYATTIKTKWDGIFETVLLWQFCAHLNHSLTSSSLGSIHSRNTANCDKGFLCISNFSKSYKKSSLEKDLSFVSSPPLQIFM